MDAGERAYTAFAASLSAWSGTPVKVLTLEMQRPVPWDELGEEQRKAWADAEAAVRRES